MEIFRSVTGSMRNIEASQGVTSAASECQPVPRWLWRWTLALVLLGGAWRIVRYLLQFPIWGDEAAVSLNFLDRNYLQLMEPLRFGQVVPIFFLWAELTVYRFLGGTECALRLLPLLAGLGGLALFWRLARLSLPPLDSTLAIAILAVAYYPIRHSCEIKPYAFDLLMSVALMTMAVAWLRDPSRPAWMWILTVTAPLALGFSYPSVFLAGTASVVMFPKLLRDTASRSRLPYFLYNAVMIATFATLYWLVGSKQFHSAAGEENWPEAFPPSNPLTLIKWLFSVHTGNMLAYPVGGHDGGSILTSLFFLVGACHLWRSHERDVLLLCGLPFALTLIAASLHRYPYGTSARIAQHLAPAICILTGVGITTFITRAAHSTIVLRRWSAVTFCLLVLLAITGIARDWVKPYKTQSDYEVRQITADIQKQAGPDDQIVIHGPATSMASGFEWYLRQQKASISWNGEVDFERLNGTSRHLWLVSLSPHTVTPEMLEARLKKVKQKIVLVSHRNYQFQFGWADRPTENYEVFHWAREGAERS